jgi:RNA polymerase sigma factor (sigma-70 family)
VPHWEDGSPFDSFFDSVYPRLVKWGVGRCGDLHDVEDATAEIMIEIRQRWAGIENPTAYAYRSLTNRIGRILRRRTDLFPTDELPDQSDSDDGIENYAGAEWVNQILERLPPMQQKVMKLLVSGAGYREIAGELGCTEETVRQNVRHARPKLRAYLREWDREPESPDSVAPRKGTR